MGAESRHAVLFATALFLSLVAGCQQDKPADTRRQVSVEDEESTADAAQSKEVKKTSSSSQSTKPKIPKDEDPTEDEPQEAPLDVLQTNPLFQLQTGEAQRVAFCSRQSRDRVRKVFCDGKKTNIKSLKELQSLLGLTSSSTRFAIAAQSNAIAQRSVSVINPRAVMFLKAAAGDHVALGFARGDGFVEVAAVDPDSGSLHFYLLTYELACGKDCSNYDRLSVKSESDWSDVMIYEDVELTNTIYDCQICHQPGGSTNAKILRMPSLQLPWPHWFLDVTTVRVTPPNNPGLSVPSNGKIPGLSGISFDPNKALIGEFLSAHSNDGEYAGIQVQRFRESAPNELANFLTDLGFGVQPNEAADVANSLVGNFQVIYPGKSAGWQRAYQAALDGSQLIPPFPGAKITDDGLLRSMTSAYTAAVASGGSQSMPDIREVFIKGSDHELGRRVKPGASAEEILNQACYICHNSSLEQSRTRARFDVDLAEMTPAQKRKAIERLRMPKNDVRLMPPQFFKELSKEEIEALVKLLAD